MSNSFFFGLRSGKTSPGASGLIILAAMLLVPLASAYAAEFHVALTGEAAKLEEAQKPAGDKLATTELLGKAAIPNLPYEQPDGKPIRIDTDYFGKPCDETNPSPGPFENPGQGTLKLKVW